MTRLIGALATAMMAVSFAMASVPASAQGTSSGGATSRITPFAVSPGRRGKQRGVEISVTYQFFISGNAQSLEDQASLSDQGRRALYTLLGRECDALLETIATTCEIRRANVNSQINRSTSRRRGVRVSGSATYRIEFKPRPSRDGGTAD
ncbi:MAG: hypothetical protein AAGG99_04225 [Pseudomonadota bacterium]